MGNTHNEINQIKRLNIENFDNINMPIQVDEFLTEIKLHLQIFSLKKQLQSQNKILQQEIFLRENIENEVKKHKSTLENLVVVHSNGKGSTESLGRWGVWEMGR
ncbi:MULTISPECIES: hypothetical protein [Okeania]|nr:MULTISPECIES: hypothetical protein [Okeania]NEP08533.1 hypothetical protein [Okeania sp. SIO4D6]NEP38938.1 hypothetical protein [Okeania sp. SIO2H7]NET23374.1 hypothetical protein [Okeania sp. SIO1H5]NET78614.1 hypothetical protein [Okeania sp. SIO1F9]NEP74049.1 hypothetical protein [Okeania sp. SIO2G5]